MAERRMNGFALVALVAVACSTSPTGGGGGGGGGGPDASAPDGEVYVDGSLQPKKDVSQGGPDGSHGGPDGARCTGSKCVDGSPVDTGPLTICGVDDAAACATGVACTMGSRCASLVCAPAGAGADGAVDGGSTSDGGPIDCLSGQACTCQPASSTDGVQNDSETDIDCGGGFLAGATANPASDGAPPCGQGASCVFGTDCSQGVCNANGNTGGPPIDCPAGTTGCTCQTPSSSDGVNNDSETGVDCGGASLPGSDNAPPCPPGQPCAITSDCASLYCMGAVAATSAAPATPGVCVAASCTDGLQDGTETDVDCGGGACPGCSAGGKCLVGTDCGSLGCAYTGLCALAPSCVSHFGGDTCGADEDIGPNPAPNPVQESCCTSLAVPGFADANFPGKTVYLDKYEITAGRMRAFIDYVSSLNGGVPDVLGYASTHRPAVNWNPGWETILPSNTGSMGQVDEATFTVGQPALLYPTGSSGPCYPPWSIVGGTYSFDVGLEYLLGPLAYFPECEGGGGGPATVSQTTGNYCEYHNFNCTNEDGAEGFGTYWFDLATEQDADPASMGKHWTQEELDEKALNCTPLGMFAAFCAWDGGQLMTEEVFQAVTKGVAIPYEGDTGWPSCNGGTITTFDTAAENCDSVYYYPYDDSTQSYDNSSIIAAPGRVPGDVVTMAGGAGPWHDLIGNLIEGVLLPSGAFGFQGAGFGFGDSVDCHTYEYSTPRMKNAATGARCMRFQ